MLDRTVLPAPYPRQLKDHFNRLSDELQLARGFAANREEWLARRPVVREKLIEALGGFPERTPLNARITGRIERDDYTIEKVVYESRPGFLVTGALYLPHLDHPVPGVFCPHGHWGEGRYAADVQRRMIGMVRRGYVVLSIDFVGKNDREAQNHNSRIAFLAGLTTQGVQVWDNIRGIDYLCSRPEVIAERIGCTGCSGGGNQTMYVSALDERITACAPVCSVELGECYMHKRFCTCETVPGLRRFADLVDVCGLIAPRALLLVHGMLDLGFQIDSARKAFARIRQIYQGLAVPERIDHFVSYDTHAYNREMREAVYAWFDRNLKGLEPPYAPEAEGPIEADADLSCLPDGLPEGSQTLVSLYHQAAKGLPPRPPVSTPVAWAEESVRLRSALAELFSGWPAPCPFRTHLLTAETETIAGVAARVESLYFFSEPDVVVPGVLYLPPATPCSVTIRFGEDGRKSVPEEVITAELAAGRGVFALDPRGMGETRFTDASLADWQAYLSSVTLGRHLAAMRAWDLRRAAECLLSRPDVSDVSLASHGSVFDGLVALLATATDQTFQHTELAVIPAAFSGETDLGELAEPGQMAVIPNLLKVADLDDLAALVAPRGLSVRQFVNGRGEPVPVPGAMERCRAVYGLLDAGERLSLPR